MVERKDLPLRDVLDIFADIYRTSNKMIFLILFTVAITIVLIFPIWSIGVTGIKGRVIPDNHVHFQFGLHKNLIEMNTPIIFIQSGQQTAGLFFGFIECAKMLKMKKTFLCVR